MDDRTILKRIETLSQKRWKVGIILEDERGAFDRFWRTHPIPNVERIDLIEELLVEILQRSDVVLGAFYEDDFHEWLVERISKNAGIKAVICTQLDAWLATFRKRDALAFFRNFAVRDYVIPVLLVTAQSALVKSSSFPIEQSWSVGEMEAS